MLVLTTRVDRAEPYWSSCKDLLFLPLILVKCCWFDSQMKLDTHITKWCSATFFHLYNIRWIRKFLNKDTAQILIHAFITSHLEYCNSLLYGLLATHLKKLQKVQNAAARLICNISRFDHITPILFYLHWHPIKFGMDFKILLTTYKALNGLASSYIKELITIKRVTRYNWGVDQNCSYSNLG